MVLPSCLPTPSSFPTLLPLPHPIPASLAPTPPAITSKINQGNLACLPLQPLMYLLALPSLFRPYSVPADMQASILQPLPHHQAPRSCVAAPLFMGSQAGDMALSVPQPTPAFLWHAIHTPGEHLPSSTGPRQDGVRDKHGFQDTQ